MKKEKRKRKKKKTGSNDKQMDGQLENNHVQSVGGGIKERGRIMAEFGA